MNDIHASTDRQFRETVNRLVKEYRIENIVETGTYDGLGSSKVFAETGLPFSTVECNLTLYEKARENLRMHKNASVYFGYSLRKSHLMEFLKNDRWEPPKEIVKDVETDPLSFYMKEMEGTGFENWLPKLLDDKRQLIYLDSAGGVGLLEVLTVLAHPFLHKKVLLLDDCNHIKHYRSCRILEAMGRNPVISDSGRLAWVSFISTQNA